MTCRRIRKLIPLAVGDDLGQRRGRAVCAHIETCPACRRELEDYRLALAQIRAAARQEGVPDWNENEWRALMARLPSPARKGQEEGESVRTRMSWARWAAASGLGVLIGLVILSVLFKGPVPGPEGAATAGRTAETGRDQDVVSLTMISQETGLQVVWFFDKNFDWKGDQD